MSWTLRDGISLHPMPFGGAFVLDGARPAARQIGSELAALLAGTDPAPADPPPPDLVSADLVSVDPVLVGPPPPALAAEIRAGVEEGWLIEEKTA
ncbi:hypothetical protein GCM10023196_022710 [Actinoallomurus vinaceus]|uniref:Uncharacterized protein n=1 Tax=Actinoallomurus vinaceus TaxID=1080074 RepID=A0ABP8U594_9ACTN